MNTTPDRDWSRIALWLVSLTMLYNVAEGVIALWSGAHAASSALIGFGLDSVIECIAAAVLLWRLRLEVSGADPETIEATESRVLQVVGGTFIALALYILGDAGSTLWTRDPPDESMVGIVLAGASLVIMPIVSWGKLRAADAIGSRALRAEAKETLACSYLSFALLLGLVLNAWLGWWWADPVAALVMVPWLVHEGREGLRGDLCCD